MSTFRVIFTGLCAYIPDQDYGDPANPPSKVMVAMVEARSVLVNPGTLDGRKGSHHHPAIIFNPLDLEGAPGASIHIRSSSMNDIFDTGAIYFLSRYDPKDRWEITFEINEEASAKNEFSIVQEGDGDFNQAVHINNIVDPNYNELDPKIFTDSESEGLISARVLLSKRGKLSTFKIDSSIEWGMAGTLGGTPLVPGQSLSNLVALEFEKTISSTVHARNISGGNDLSFTFRGDREVNIIVGNLCANDLTPSPQLPLTEFQNQRRDADFRFYYNLLAESTRSAVPKILQGVSLPLPTPLLHRGGSGYKILQCLRLNTAKVDFTNFNLF